MTNFERAARLLAERGDRSLMFFDVVTKIEEIRFNATHLDLIAAMGRLGWYFWATGVSVVFDGPRRETFGAMCDWNNATSIGEAIAKAAVAVLEGEGRRESELRRGRRNG